jgi:dTDP-4-amino-4,6-dideoxygalactose transaminase
VTIIEDAAHAMGAKREKGEHGDFVCYSLQAIKHLTTGDGGILVCPGAALTERARLLRWFGLDRTRGDSMRCYQQVAEAGFKMQSNDIAAAIGLANLPSLAERVEKCRDNAAFFNTALGGLRNVDLPPPSAASAWWIYTIRVSSPVLFERFMAAQGVAVGQVHARNDTNPCFDNSAEMILPGVEAFADHQTNLPCAWHVTTQDRQRIVEAVTAWSKTPEARW